MTGRERSGQRSGERAPPAVGGRQRYRAPRRPVEAEPSGGTPPRGAAGGGPVPRGAGEDAARRLLGDLEAEIMEVMWRRERAMVRDVLEELRRRRELAYTTVMTVMARLAEKGVLRRELAGRAHAYEVALSREAFVRDASERLVRSLVDDFGDVAVAAMAEELERVDPARLERLRRRGGKTRRGAASGGATAG